MDESNVSPNNLEPIEINSITYIFIIMGDEPPSAWMVIG